MGVLSGIAQALKAIQQRKPGSSKETYILDRKKGSIEIRTHPGLGIRLELFKRFTNKKSWGFELTVRNNSEWAFDEVLIIFNKKFSIILDDLAPDSMKIKSLEFAAPEFDSDDFSVDISIVSKIEKKADSQAFSLTIPMYSIIKELKELGKITPIQEQIETYKPGSINKEILQGFEADFIKHASIKPRVPIMQSSKGEHKEMLGKKLLELSNQKSEITKSFMKREIDYATFSQLMNPIVQETILIKAELGKMDSK